MKKAQGVLIVDDMAISRSLVIHYLKQLGYESFAEASDGDEAMKFLFQCIKDQTTPGLIISDITMPNMDGISLVKNLRTLPQLQNIPIIMITGETTDDFRTRALDAGANQFLNKPFSIMDLQSALGNLENPHE